MVAVNYLWNPINDNIVREFDDTGATIAEYTTEPDLYGNVVSQYRNGQTSYLLSDGQGNTTELTNDAGDVTDTIRYSAFGEITKRTGSTEIPFQYVGKKGYYKHEPTANYLVRRRVLSGSAGRWLSPDPLGVNSFAGFVQRNHTQFGLMSRIVFQLASNSQHFASFVSIHRYVAVRSNPLIVTDPSGMIIECKDKICDPEKLGDGIIDGTAQLDASIEKEPEDIALFFMPDVQGALGHIGALIKLNDTGARAGCGPGGKGTRLWVSARIYLSCTMETVGVAGETQIRDCIPPGEQGKWILDKGQLVSTELPFKDFPGMDGKIAPTDSLFSIRGYAIAILCECPPDSSKIMTKPVAEFAYVLGISVSAKPKLRRSVYVMPASGKGLNWQTIIPSPPITWDDDCC